MRDSTLAGTGDRLPQSSDWHTNSSQTVELMQHSSFQFINSKNPKLSPIYSAKFPLSSVGSASHHVATVSRSLVTLLILILTHSFVQHYLEQNSWKLKTK